MNDNNSELDINDNEKPLAKYRGSIDKLVDLLVDDCIDETILKDALKNIRNQCQQVIWNSEHEFVLKHVGEQCMIYDKIYIESSQKMKKIQSLFIIPMFILTLIGSSVMYLSVYSNPLTQYYLGIIGGSINLLLAFLQKITEYLQPEKKSIDSHNYSKFFRRLYDDITTQLMLSRQDREQMPMYLNRILTEFYELKKNSPHIDSEIIKNFKKRHIDFARERYIDDFYKSTPIEIGELVPIRIHGDNDKLKRKIPSDIEKKINIVDDSKNEIIEVIDNNDSDNINNSKNNNEITYNI